MDSTNFKTKRLTKDSGYQRPIKTVQDSLTADDIKDKLKGYKKVSDITKIIIGSHMRYFTKDPKKNNGLVVNTLHRMMQPIAEKYPQKLKLIKTIGTIEPTYLYEIDY